MVAVLVVVEVAFRRIEMMSGDAASGRRILGGHQRRIAERDGAEDVDDVDGHEHEREHENDARGLPPAGVPT